jgi:hypothetical protein
MLEFLAQLVQKGPYDCAKSNKASLDAKQSARKLFHLEVCGAIII